MTASPILVLAAKKMSKIVSLSYLATRSDLASIASAKGFNARMPVTMRRRASRHVTIVRMPMSYVLPDLRSHIALTIYWLPSGTNALARKLQPRLSIRFARNAAETKSGPLLDYRARIRYADNVSLAFHRLLHRPRRNPSKQKRNPEQGRRK